MTDRKAEKFFEEESETDAGMMEDLEHSVQLVTEQHWKQPSQRIKMLAMQLSKRRKIVSYQRWQSVNRMCRTPTDRHPS